MIGTLIYILIGFIFAMIGIKALYHFLGPEEPFIVGIVFFMGLCMWPILGFTLLVIGIIYGIGYILTKLLER